MTQQGYPLTSIQEGMVFHHAAGGHRGVDIEQILIDFPISPDTALFLQAWERVLAAHPSLASRLHEEGGATRLAPEPGFRLPVTEAVQADNPADWEHWLEQDRERGFDLFKDVPMRLAHGPLDGGRRFVWTFHHLLLDGRSFPDVLVDVLDAYQALVEGRSADVPGRPDRTPYLNWLQALDHSRSMNFWGDHLNGLESSGSLVDAPDPAASWALQTLHLPEEETRALRAGAEALEAGMGTLVQAAWAVLLGRYTDQQDVCFGVTRAGRQGSPVPDTDRMLGVFINTVPARVRLEHLTGRQLLATLQQFGRDVRPHERTPLTLIQRAAEGLPSPLFDSLVMFDHASLQAAIHQLRPQLKDLRFTLRERPPYPVTLYAYADPELQLRINHRRDAATNDQAWRMLAHVRQLLTQLVQRPDTPLSELTMLTPEDYSALRRFNQTAAEVPFQDIHTGFRRAVDRHPDRTALLAGGRSLSYQGLDALVSRMAAGLRQAGVEPGSVVGIGLPRSFELVAAVLATLRVGAAYLPLDPDYPVDRLQHYVRDSGAGFIVSAPAQRSLFADAGARLLDAGALASGSADAQAPHGPGPEDLAYIIYTSGSTGVPNGVMLRQRNVVNFFAGMDRVITPDPPGRWLAVTSLSFDISVLELLWTLTRGYEVAIHGAQSLEHAGKRAGFSMFHFAQGADETDENPYRLILEAARFADEAGFEAVWSPERHFHDFGAPYPNPSVIGAAIAATTQRIGIRAGSVVLPLHDPLRVAEEWALVDQLSDGRIGLAMASGWQPNDFALAPDSYENRKEVMYAAIEQLRALWRGEAVERVNGVGDAVALKTYPRPRQKELPIWITAAGNPNTFAQAGAIGANVLTHMLGQSVEQVRANLAASREARHANGFDDGHVTLMLHTFIGEDEARVKELVREPMKRYLASSASLVGQYADTWSAYRRGSAAQVSAGDIAELDEDTRDELFEFAFERFFETSSLLGSRDKCARLVEALLDAGVNEIACLIDFGVPTDQVIAHLPYIAELEKQINGDTGPGEEPADLAEDIRRFAPTHLQCTPSQARMLLLGTDENADFTSLRHVMLGGEAVPPDLCQELYGRLSRAARITNMYGPTETTIWSTTADVPRDAGTVAIGHPIVNTGCHVLDSEGHPVPEGRTGELFISGDGLALGYHDRPELNARRFVLRRPDPESDPVRMYATGDLVRLTDQGLVYVGRRDFQLKVRGYRIELGEIESALRQRQDVQDAVVMARPDAAGSLQLAAYLVPKPGIRLDRTELQTALRQQLPDYMVPGIYVQLPRLPLTPNGKIDRKALPDPGQGSLEAPAAEAAPTPAPASPAEPAGGKVEPAGKHEDMLQELWQRLLGQPEIGREDNFFDLGGHSILAVKLQGELRKALGFRVPVTEIFRNPTIAGLAGRLQALEAAKGR
ncbi:MAG: LLM class flavin-dependent oxidoreductase [Ectothiorhodospiraceae bacterium]|nr:LLM class flavin-dependent oxidoreductase [Ectothiorhodospiraceae bacterium]